PLSTPTPPAPASTLSLHDALPISRRSPWKFGNLHFTILFLRLRFRQTAPGDLGIGKHNGGNRVRLKGDFVAGNRFHRDSSLVRGDRKSTRLNSSHLVISYAVFCLK